MTSDPTSTSHHVPVAPGVDLWVGESGDPDGTPVLMVMGAASSGVLWNQRLIERLGRRHRVVIYDHRDTGRSSHAFDQSPYELRDLATDAVTVLDALGIEQAHVAGMSMGGMLVQLMLLDHPGRLLSATLLCTGALPGADGGEELPGPSAELLALWASLGDPRDAAAELDWRVEHWRLLNGTQTAFDEAEFRALEQRAIAHGGSADASSATAHARAGTEGLARGAELGEVSTPVLVIEAPADPAYPPPHSEFLACTLGSARLVQVPGMGHALPDSVIEPLDSAIEEHLRRVDQPADDQA